MEKKAEKRSAEEQQSLLHDAKAILTEVEGTTTPIAFVKEKLYGYIKEHAETYLSSNFSDKEVQDLIDGLRKQAAADKESGAEDVVIIPAADAAEADVIKAIVDSITGYLNKGKITEPLRKIFGIIWRDGYKKKEIVGELFDDVVPALRKLAEQGTRVYVFSSRCADSQRLLFGYSKDGDLSEMISGYFDVSAGPRTDKDTYVKIAKDLELAPSDVLYLTHQSTEATAAHSAGMKTTLVVRPGNPKLAEKDVETFVTISSFAQLFGDEAEIPHKKKACHEHSSLQKACHEHSSPQKACHEHSGSQKACHATHGTHCEAAKEAK